MAGTNGFRDRYGLTLGTSSATAADLYVDAIERDLAGNLGAVGSLKQALEADEGFALAHAALARTLQLGGFLADARTHAERARSLAAGASRREQQHVEFFVAAVTGDTPHALALAREHLAEFPRDAFVLHQLVGPFGLVAFGAAENWHDDTVTLLETVASDYGDDWWFVGALAFVYMELNRFESARRLAERCLELQPRSAHGAHALAHVFYETADHTAVVAFLEDWIEGFERNAPLYTHFNWHIALSELAVGQPGRVLERYEREMRPGVSQAPAASVLFNAASLLWRWELYGCGPGRLSWSDVRDHAAGSFPRPGHSFIDAHLAFAYAGARDEAALSRIIDGLRELDMAGHPLAGRVMLPLVQGIAAYARGDYEQTVRWIEPVAGTILRIGGSNAQREVFEDTLLEAYLRTGRCEQAEALLRGRLNRRPSARDLFWLGRAQAGAGRVDDARISFGEATVRWRDAEPDSPEFAALQQTQQAVQAAR